jgi:hypothetical protein
MSVSDLATLAVRGDLDALEERAKTDRHDPDAEPLSYAMAGQMLVSGTAAEFDGFRRPTHREAGVARGLFRTATTTAARRTLREHPEEIDEVRSHKWVLDKLGTRPMRRRSRKEQAVAGLAKLLSQPETVLDYHDRGLFAWSGGDADAAVVTANAWRYTLYKREPPNMSRLDEWSAYETVLSGASEANPENGFVRLVDARYRLAWGALQPGERAKLAASLSSLGDDAGDDDRSTGLRLAARTAEVDAALRFPDVDAVDAERSVDRLAAALPDGDYPRVEVLRAWAAARKGDRKRAVDLASRAADGDVPLAAADASQVLEAVGATEAAEETRKSLSRSLSTEFSPDMRTNVPTVPE